MNALPVCDDRYIKTKTRTYGHNIYTNFRGLDVPDDGAECKSFKIISFNSLLVYENKYYLQVYLDNCAYIIIYTQMLDYLDGNFFETAED